MENPSKSSRVIASDLRRAERSINTATRDTTQLLLSMLDGLEAHEVAPATAQPAIKATIDTLAALAESQSHLGVRAHDRLTRVALALGLTEVDWGVGYPKTEPNDGPMAVERTHA